MWNKVWYSLGKTTGFAVTSIMLSSRRRPSTSIKAVEQQAETIARVLRERGIVPNRVGIDGVPGSGKSTLACALAIRLDMKRQSLDYKNVSRPGNLDQERTIYEHHRLFRTHDVDSFDAIVYIDEPVERSKAKVTWRPGRLILAAALDYNKLKKVGEIAFDVCQGAPIAIPDSYLILKIKPPEGFRASENIVSRLSAAGFDTGAAPDVCRDCAGGMRKEEMLFVLAYGRRQDGLKAYCFCLPLACMTRLGSLAAGLHRAGRRFITVLRAQDAAGGHRGACPSACG